MIVSTYNRPEALRAVLESAHDQVYRDFELVVADDGSSGATADVVRQFQQAGRTPIRHVWHEDRGFRLAAIRNRAAAASTAEYLVFIDGDCIIFPDFLERHARLAEPGFFVRGSKVNLNRALTESVVREGKAVHRWTASRWFFCRARGQVNRFMPFLRIPQGPLRKLSRRSMKGASGRNLAVWRKDFVAVNGFNEEYQGYGMEDWDFVDRLIKRGVCRKNGRFAVPVIHLWHERRAPAPNNDRIWEVQRRSSDTWVERGVGQYL